MKDGETTKKNLDFSRKKYTVVIKIAQKIEILINKTIPDFFLPLLQHITSSSTWIT